MRTSKFKIVSTAYDVIIIGGGPVGVALGIELGLQSIRVLILEQHKNPLKTPRAQSLSARTMEFFLRWGIDEKLENSVLLPKDLQQAGVWCSSLNGETYFVGNWGDNQLAFNTSPKKGERIPLWITERILRQRLEELPTVSFLKEHEVLDVAISGKNSILVRSLDKANQLEVDHSASFVACCDGANGASKSKFNNFFSPLSDKTKILGLTFVSDQIQIKKTVPDGIFYVVTTKDITSFISPIDLHSGQWIAQIIWSEPSLSLDEALLSNMLDELLGEPFDKKIIETHFWDMQVQIADFFSFQNRVFWLGDAAHAFAPTGGLGLNTGMGDAQNLGWKLASVIKKTSPISLLSSYEKERRPVCLNNLNFAKKNAEASLEVKKKYPPDEDYQAFARVNAELGKYFLLSSALTMGYTYEQPIVGQETFSEKKIEDSMLQYIPKVEVGYFLPHMMWLGRSIYAELSPIHWTLLVCCQQINKDLCSELQLLLSNYPIRLLQVDAGLYPCTYILLRPDWHISVLGNELNKIIAAMKKIHGSNDYCSVS